MPSEMYLKLSQQVARNLILLSSSLIESTLVRNIWPGAQNATLGLEVGDVARGGGHSSDTSSDFVKQKKLTTGPIKGRRSWLPLLPLEQ